MPPQLFQGRSRAGPERIEEYQAKWRGSEWSKREMGDTYMAVVVPLEASISHRVLRAVTWPVKGGVSLPWELPGVSLVGLELNPVASTTINDKELLPVRANTEGDDFAASSFRITVAKSGLSSGFWCQASWSRSVISVVDREEIRWMSRSTPARKSMKWRNQYNKEFNPRSKN